MEISSVVLRMRRKWNICMKVLANSFCIVFNRGRNLRDFLNHFVLNVASGYFWDQGILLPST